VFNKVQLAELFVLFCQRCVRAGVQDATHNVVDDNDEPSSTRDDVSPSPKRDRTSAEDDDVTTPSLCRNAASTQTATVVRGDDEGAIGIRRNTLRPLPTPIKLSSYFQPYTREGPLRANIVLCLFNKLQPSTCSVKYYWLQSTLSFCVCTTAVLCSQKTRWNFLICRNY